MYTDKSSKGIVYKTLGLTHVSPDIESINHMVEVAENFNIPYNLVDPNDATSPGLNPFVYDDPSLTAVAISTVLKGMYNKNQVGENEAFMINSATQAVENLSILLKVMYPRLHNGDLPTLEDMLKMLNNFELIEDMCKKMEQIPELSEEYSLQLGYFKKHFYKESSIKADTERYVYSAINQLDSLLRIGSVRNILCNRVNNLNFDNILENGEITFVCTRRGDLGATAHLAFGLFFMLLMQFSVLRRPGNENSRIPHFLYVDDFAEYICPATEPLYTIYRKYHVGTIISTQNLTSLGARATKYRDLIMSNATTKLVFGGVTREESEIWQKEFGDHREWKFTSTYNADKVEYDSKIGSPKWEWKENIASGKLQALKFKDCAYIIKDLKGRNNYGDGKVDFLEAKYKEPHLSKSYDFAKFTSGIAEEEKKISTNLTKQDYETDMNGDIDPIKLDNTDSKFLFENQDAIIFDLKKDN